LRPGGSFGFAGLPTNFTGIYKVQGTGIISKLFYYLIFLSKYLN